MFSLRSGRVLHVLFAGVILAISITGAWNAVRLGISDYRSSLSMSERQRAVESGICNADFWLRLADLKREAGEDNIVEIQRAAECNPENSEAHILLGLAYEAHGNTERAGELLHQATEMDHGLVPRWTLANFYLRRGDNDHFFKWIHEALAVARGDVIWSAFYLCWNISKDKDRILSAIPHTNLILSDYRDWLTRTQHFDAARDVSRLLSVSANRPPARDILASLCDRDCNCGSNLNTRECTDRTK